MDYILQFNMKFAHTSSAHNLADALLQVNTVKMPTLLSVKRISEAQISDEQLPHLLNNI